jgi:hypothetical protein
MKGGRAFQDKESTVKEFFPGFKQHSQRVIEKLAVQVENFKYVVHQFQISLQ